MIKFPQMCPKCEKRLHQLAAKEGGLVFCSHRSASPTSGVFVAAIPVDGGARCQLQIIYPCTAKEAREKADEMIAERRGNDGTKR